MKDLKEKNLGYSSISKYNLAFFEKEVLELVEADKQGFEFTNSWKVFEQFKLNRHSIVVDRIDKLFEIVKERNSGNFNSTDCKSTSYGEICVLKRQLDNSLITAELSRELPDIGVLHQWFKECTIKDGKGRNQRGYKMSIDGFNLVISGYKGEEADLIRFKFIRQFWMLRLLVGDNNNLLGSRINIKEITKKCSEAFMNWYLIKYNKKPKGYLYAKLNTYINKFVHEVAKNTYETILSQEVNMRNMSNEKQNEEYVQVMKTLIGLFKNNNSLQDINKTMNLIFNVKHIFVL